MNHELIRKECCDLIVQILIDPSSLWNRLNKSKAYQTKINLFNLNNYTSINNSFLTITMSFDYVDDISFDINYSIKDSYSQQIYSFSQNQIKTPQEFINHLKVNIQKAITLFVFAPNTNWNLLTLTEIQDIVVPKMKSIKSDIRKYLARNDLSKSSLLESSLNEVKNKLNQISNPELRQYINLIELLET